MIKHRPPSSCSYQYFFWLCLAVAISYSQTATAHSTLFATYILKKDDSGWNMSVNFPLYSLHHVLLMEHSKNELIDKNGKYQKEIAIKYLLKTISIKANNERMIILESQSVSLDDHQSQFYFSLKDMPDNLKTLNFDISSMSENPGHTNIVRVFSKDSKSNKKVVLNNSNQYKGNINF